MEVLAKYMKESSIVDYAKILFYG